MAGQAGPCPSRANDRLGGSGFSALTVHGNSYEPGTFTAGHVDERGGHQQWSLHMPLSCSQHLCPYTYSHIPTHLTPLPLHTHSLHTHILMYIPLLPAHTCTPMLTPLPDICSHPRAQTHPLMTLTCLHTPTFQTLSCTQFPPPTPLFAGHHSDTAEMRVACACTHISPLAHGHSAHAPWVHPCIRL